MFELRGFFVLAGIERFQKTHQRPGADQVLKNGSTSGPTHTQLLFHRFLSDRLPRNDSFMYTHAVDCVINIGQVFGNSTYNSVQ